MAPVSLYVGNCFSKRQYEACERPKSRGWGPHEWVSVLEKRTWNVLSPLLPLGGTGESQPSVKKWHLTQQCIATLTVDFSY